MASSTKSAMGPRLQEREKAMKMIWKRATTILLALAMSAGLCIGLAACSSTQNDEQVIRSELDKAFAALKNPTDDVIKEFADEATLQEMEEFGVDPAEMLKHFFGKFEYTIDSVKVDGDKAVATVTTTNVDFQAVMDDFTNNITSNDELMAKVTETMATATSEKDLYPIIFEYLFKAIDESDKLATDTYDISIEKKNGTWDFTEEGKQTLMSAMFGGMDLSGLM